jgi:acetyl esterase/lipase
VVQVAGLDPLRDEGIAYAQSLLQGGVPTKLEMFNGVPHGFGGMPILSKYKLYHENTVNFVNQIVHTSHADLTAKL